MIVKNSKAKHNFTYTDSNEKKNSLSFVVNKHEGSMKFIVPHLKPKQINIESTEKKKKNST